MEMFREMWLFLLEGFQRYSGGNHIWFLYPAALLGILIWGSRTGKKIFLGTVLLQCLTLFNPLFADLLVNHFGFSERYHRFFWTVPFYAAVGYASVLLIFRFRRKTAQAAAGAVCAALILSLGRPVFWGEGVPAYRPTENGSFIDGQIPELAVLLHSEGIQEPVVLYGALMFSYRQYDPSVKSLFNRQGYQLLQGTSLEDFMEMDMFHDAIKNIARVYFYGDYSVDAGAFYSALCTRADYVVSYVGDLDEYLRQTPMTLLGQAGGYKVWKVSG